MRKIKLLVKTTVAVCSLCAPILLMIIGIWMIYNVDFLIGSVIGFIGCVETLYYGQVALEVIESRKTK